MGQVRKMTCAGPTSLKVNACVARTLHGPDGFISDLQGSTGLEQMGSIKSTLHRAWPAFIASCDDVSPISRLDERKST